MFIKAHEGATKNYTWEKSFVFFQYLVWYIYSLAALAELITGDSITLVMSKSKSKTFTKPFTKLLNKISNLEKKT